MSSPLQPHHARDPHIEALLAAYDVGAFRSCQVLSGGMFLKPTMIWTDRGRFVLRAHTFRASARTFEYQAGVLNGAASGGIRCPRVVPRTDGRWGMRRRGAYWALHEYADGHLLDWPRWLARKRDGQDFMYWLGTHVATLHNVLADLAVTGEPGLDLGLPPIRFHRLGACCRHFRRSVEALAEGGSSRSETVSALNDPAIETAWSRLLRAASRLRPYRLPRQIVHGDISPVNLVWRTADPSGSEPPTFIDWDCTHLGVRLYDALGDVLLRAPGDRPDTHIFDPDEVRVYLNGYSAAVNPPLSTSELRCVPIFLMARQLEDLRQRVAVAPSLSAERDAEYAELVRMRIRLLDQLAPYVENQKGTHPWM